MFADQELGALGGVAGDGAAGLGAVGEAGGVAEEGEAGLGMRSMRARRTVSPPKPESKTPMVGGGLESFMDGFLRWARRRRRGRCG